MRICMIAEGSYPYVTGGVSSWMQMFMEGMPEHEFVVYSIGAEEKDRGKFKYKLPANVVEVREIFLDSILNMSNPKNLRFPLTPKQREVLSILVCGEGDINLDELLGIFRTTTKKDALNIFMSFDFFDVITSVYQAKFSHLPFTDFFWTVRSMLLPLLFLLQQDFPKVDLYHSVATGYAGAVGSLAAQIYEKPFILTEHGIYSREREEEIIQSSWAQKEFKDLWINYFYSLARLTYEKADKVYTLFGKNAEIQVSLGCDASKVSIIPNGIDVERYGNVPESLDDNGSITIGGVVRVVPIKDIITMLRSFSLVKKEIPDARFIVIGPIDEDKEYYEECLETVEGLGLQENVEFTGTVNVRDYLGKIDILVLSSISEGQPLAVLEGMANKKPFVSTDVGCCKELLYGNDDGFGKAGIVVSVMDFEEMAKAFITLARDKSLRKSMGGNGYQRVSQFYTKDGMIDSYKQIYAGLRR